jgi:hypothetical protein
MTNIIQQQMYFELERHPQGKFSIGGHPYRPIWPRGCEEDNRVVILNTIETAVGIANETFEKTGRHPERIYVSQDSERTRVIVIDKK